MKKVLVAYYSPTGHTKKAAAEIAETIDADIYEILPAVPYTAADLNWSDEKARSTVEMNDRAFRPALADQDANVGQYDIIFLGFPIWWYVAPTIINSFLEAYDFSGKKIVLFATSGGSDFGKTLEGLRPSVSEDTVMVEGKILNSIPSQTGFDNWVYKMVGHEEE